MTTRLCLIVALLLVGCRSQPPRFRYLLHHAPEVSADRLRQNDSILAVEDRRHGCPSRADTLWASDTRTAIPGHWLEASLRTGCGHAGLPFAVRRRLRDDPAALAYYAGVLRDSIPASEDARAWAVRQLSWSADQRYFPLIQSAAREGTPGLTESGDYNTAYWATVELAPYVSRSREARRVVWSAATHPTSEYARAAGILALAAANDRWSRGALRRLPLDAAEDHARRSALRALAHAPCKRGTILVEWFGVEGQDYSRCEPPPDYR